MVLKELTDIIETFAPLSLQESYDNSGLIVGRPSDEVHKALLAVDVTDEVMDEAEREGCDIIITHHPIVFHPLKRFNSANMVERCVERAIRQGIALYACHTNLDSTAEGMSWRLASMLGVENLEVLQPTTAGEPTGFGVIGIATEQTRRVAVCTGSGAFLIGEARNAGADVYITADLKYNDFMTPDRALTVADIGHFESEYCAIEILFDILSKKFLTFAVRKSECSRNPINYLTK